MQLVIQGVLTHAEDIPAETSSEQTTVVILPGWGQDSRHWTAWAALLPRSFRYVIPDLPGFGQTQHLPPGAGVWEYGEWLREFLAKSELSRPVLFGHSFGGQVATAFAAKYPDELAALLLLSPSSLRLKTREVRSLEFLYRTFRWLKRLTPSVFYEKLRPYLASDDYLRATAEQQRVLSKVILQDLSKELRKIAVPTYILWGEQDAEIPYAGKRLAEGIPDAHLQILYGCDHNPQLTAPQKLADLTKEILENL